MSETMLTEAIAKMQTGTRPLASLSNAALFQYPEADSSDEAARKFRAEILHRRGVPADRVRERLHQAKVNVEAARKSIESNRDKGRDEELKSILSKRTQALATASVNAEDVKDKATWLTTNEINSHFREKNIHRLEPLTERWKKGTLFSCQGFGFASFLLADPKDRNLDFHQFDEWQGLAMLCSEEHTKLYNEILCFFHGRIIPSMKSRERFTDGEGSGKTLCAVMSLADGMKKDYWTWLRNYNALTVRFRWADDGGTAYSKQGDLSQPEPITEFKDQF